VPAAALAPGEVETVEAPPIKGEFVAYRVGNGSPGFIEGDVIYTPPPSQLVEDAVGKQCIVRLGDGRRRLCWLMPGDGPGRYIVLTPTLTAIYDAEVVEAAPVTWIRRAAQP
jgi:hypothetical protein